MVSEDSEDTDSETEMFPVDLVPKSDYGKPEIVEAIDAEIEKYRKFQAFEEVQDEGQDCIPTRWVITKQKEDGKNAPYKARLCMRGDLEVGKENLRADAPTASKEALKIALMISANENFKVKAGDIKSAFLQGEKMDRELFVRPPKEAN